MLGPLPKPRNLSFISLWLYYVPLFIGNLFGVPLNIVLSSLPVHACMCVCSCVCACTCVYSISYFVANFLPHCSIGLNKSALLFWLQIISFKPWNSNIGTLNTMTAVILESVSWKWEILMKWCTAQHRFQPPAPPLKLCIHFPPSFSYISYLPSILWQVAEQGDWVTWFFDGEINPQMVLSC